jgi:hypothetical protein
MAEIRCEANEHSYDPAKYSSCPYCRRTVPNLPDPQAPPAVPPGPAPEAVPEPPGTVIDWKPRPKPADAAADDSPAPPPPLELDGPPVVGWLVVVGGPGAGKDRRIYPGMNWIGRDPGMDIPLDFGDPGISSREHAVIIYDVETNGFYLKHEKGRNLTRLNERRVTGETVLKTHDRIRINDTEMLFIPLCGGRFQWGLSA